MNGDRNGTHAQEIMFLGSICSHDGKVDKKSLGGEVVYRTETSAPCVAMGWTSSLLTIWEIPVSLLFRMQHNSCMVCYGAFMLAERCKTYPGFQ